MISSLRFLLLLPPLVLPSPLINEDLLVSTLILSVCCIFSWFIVDVVLKLRGSVMFKWFKCYLGEDR